MRPSGTRMSASVTASDVKVAHLASLGLDEVAAGLDPLAHELHEDVVRDPGGLDLDAQKRARRGVHRRLPELFGVHLAEALEALDVEVLDVELLDDPVALLLGLRVAGLLARAHAVERRLRDVQEP